MLSRVSAWELPLTEANMGVLQKSVEWYSLGIIGFLGKPDGVGHDPCPHIVPQPVRELKRGIGATRLSIECSSINRVHGPVVFFSFFLSVFFFFRSTELNYFRKIFQIFYLVFYLQNVLIFFIEEDFFQKRCFHLDSDHFNTKPNQTQ